MGLFDFLFGKKDAAPAQPEAAAPPAKAPATLNFDPEFIPALKQEHRTLLGLYIEVKKAYEAQNFAAVKKGLQNFQTALGMHLALENSKFYSYLRRNLPHGSTELNTMNSFFDEMQEIGKVATQFLRKYIYADFTPELQAAFGPELEAIGAALASRIDREEETLYKLYAPA